MDWRRLERKYVEERVSVLKRLMEKYGNAALEDASRAKQETIKKRIREQYKGELPLSLDRLYKETFEGFEDVGEYNSHQILEKTKNRLKIRVNHCQYAELYRSLNAADIGEAMVCRMDHAQNQAFNPKVKLKRPKKLMLGDDCCIFEYEVEE